MMIRKVLYYIGFIVILILAVFFGQPKPKPVEVDKGGGLKAAAEEARAKLPESK